MFRPLCSIPVAARSRRPGKAGLPQPLAALSSVSAHYDAKYIRTLEAANGQGAQRSRRPKPAAGHMCH